MRDIKFRAWDKKRKRMYKVLHLHLASFDGPWATVEGYDVINQQEINIQIQPKDIELREYTGLKDKNGREIYEGDVVRHEGSIHPIKYFNEYGIFAMAGHLGYGREKDFDTPKGSFGSSTAYKPYLLKGHARRMEVIGNIYSNPELLEAK